MRRDRVWHHGDPVSTVTGTETGVVLRCTSKRTGDPYFKVKIRSGPRAGQWTWPDNWELGEGPHLRRCADPECARPFRTRDGHDDLCPSCRKPEKAELAVRRTERTSRVVWRDEERGRGRRHLR